LNATLPNDSGGALFEQRPREGAEFTRGHTVVQVASIRAFSYREVVTVLYKGRPLNNFGVFLSDV
jgi:hypothetical protein